VPVHVTLRLELDAAPDAVWEFLHDSVALGMMVAPLLEIEPVGHRRFPAVWTQGDHLVRARLFGLVAIGDQLIRLSSSARGGARILEDSGGPVSGLLGLVTGWRHRMAVSAAPDGRTRYLDRLDFSAGVLTPFIWFGVWAFWQYRAHRIRHLVAAG
jgi:hypothetical protein